MNFRFNRKHNGISFRPWSGERFLKQNTENVNFGDIKAKNIKQHLKETEKTSYKQMGLKNIQRNPA